MDNINFTDMDKSSIKVTVLKNLAASTEETKELFNWLLNKKPGFTNILHNIFKKAYDNLETEIAEAINTYLNEDNNPGIQDLVAEFMEENMNWPLQFLGYEFTENERFASQLLDLTRENINPDTFSCEN